MPPPPQKKKKLKKKLAGELSQNLGPEASKLHTSQRRNQLGGS